MKNPAWLKCLIGGGVTGLSALAAAIWLWCDASESSQKVYVGGSGKVLKQVTPQLSAVQQRMAELPRMQERETQARALSEGLSDWFRQFEGLTGKGTTRERGAALQQILARGDEAEINKLYEFLAKSDPGKNFAGLKRLGLASLQNDIMDYAVSRDPNPKRAADALLGIAADRQHEKVARNYAYQHLDELYARVEVMGGNDREHYRQRIVKALEQGLTQRQGNVAGTALLALRRLRTEQEQGWEEGQLAQLAVRMALDKNTDELARGTALQLAADYGHDEVLPVARQLAGQARDSSQRASALAVLGRLGVAEDVKFLEETAQGGAYPLNVAAQGALARLKQRGVIQ
jgi:ribosomal protein S30